MKHFANIEDYLVRARGESARPYRVRAVLTVVVNDKFERVNLKKTDIYNN